MKKIFQKNQIMITALALMLAVAGYFSFMKDDISDKNIAAEANANLLEEEYEISDEDMISGEDIFVAEEYVNLDGTEVTSDEVTASGTEVALNGNTGEKEINPGEVMLTSTVVTVDYASEMKLSREQVRSKNKETLMEIINNVNLDDSVKQDAINKMIEATEIAERENAAEIL